MTDRELMQQALEILEFFWDSGYRNIAVKQKATMDALRERLAQPEMQPCAGRNCGSTNPNLHSAECFEDYEKATGMRAWQGLTDEEVSKLIDNEIGFNSCWGPEEQFARAIEAKLKEKNND